MQRSLDQEMMSVAMDWGRNGSVSAVVDEVEKVRIRRPTF